MEPIRPEAIDAYLESQIWGRGGTVTASGSARNSFINAFSKSVRNTALYTISHPVAGVSLSTAFGLLGTCSGSSLGALMANLIELAVKDPAERVKVYGDALRIIKENMEQQVAVSGDEHLGRVMRRSMALLEDAEGRVVGACATMPDMLTDTAAGKLDKDESRLKYTPPGGSVMVAASRAAAPDPAVVIGVRDTGRGIAPEDLRKIFEKFVQVESPEPREGVGLGLSIAREFVNLHGGRMWAESEPGKGATFYFTLPLAPDTHCRPALQHRTRVPPFSF
jgi:hypothetical protein